MGNPLRPIYPKRDRAVTELPPILVWFRQDLRLADNPALHYASQQKRPIIPVYIWAPEEEGDWPPGAASRWWLHHSLNALDASLRKKKSRLILGRGPSEETLRDLMEQTGATELVWNRRYEPAIIARDKQLKQTFKSEGFAVRSFNSALLFEPDSVLTKTGTPYQVFTPFYRACLAQDEPAGPLRTPTKLPAPETFPESLDLDSFELLPTIPWDKAFYDHWTPGEAGAEAQLERFLSADPPDAPNAHHRANFIDYQERRNTPSVTGTSRMSPHLHFGEISPRAIWHAALERASALGGSDPIHGAKQYTRQLVWRDFAHQLLFHFPHTPNQPLRPAFEHFPWRDDPKQLAAWQRGNTGYPIVDAGMRELWTTGWMHNRVRMIVGSLLVKHQLISWQEGAAWFWDTLVDADLANNTLGWQWIGGCGADAAPYFRIFNPMTQGEKFDKAGEYTKRWCPELSGLSGKTLFAPWTAPSPPTDYPAPVIEHKAGRERALAAFAEMKDGQ